MKTDIKEKRYDVLICKCGDPKSTVYQIDGQNMPLSHGSFHTAEKRSETVSGRLNDNYFCIIVDAGKFKVGDPISCEDATND